MTFRTIDLFAGCGGMSLGFLNAGYDIIMAYDHWKPAIEVYSQNFTHPIYDLDLSELDVIAILSQQQPEMVIGGPPCQDFSSAGKRDESLGRADLTVTFAEIVAGIKPQWFVMENVDRIRKSHVLKQAKTIFRKSHYSLNEIVLTASYYGVPQNRKRYFLIGELGGDDDALLPYLEQKLTDEPMTIYDYLGDSLGIE